MAQLNPNFEIDFSDINSYEQIQLINDTQLAKENLLMHRAYKEPSDDEIIKNHFSSFTFVDFCPKVFTATTASNQQVNSTGSSAINRESVIQKQQALRYYELETFSDLFERINTWLKLNKDWRVVSMETLIFDCTSQFNHLKSSIYSNYLPQNTRGLRLFLSPSKSRFSGPQKIGCINVVPRKVSGSHSRPDKEPLKYETLDQILSRLNELLLTRPIEGRILSVETITLPMMNGYVNTESNYFMDGRLNLLGQSTYSLARPEQKSGCSSTSADASSYPLPPANDPTLRGHSLIDILRVYYEFGPMVCGLVNLIDFIPRFYSPTPTTGEHQQQVAANLASEQDAASQQHQHQQPQSSAEKIAATESMTRLIRRSLAWFEAERKRVLSETSSSSSLSLSSSSQQRDIEAPVNLKLCNLQVHHKTLLKSQLLQMKPGEPLKANTRIMAHERLASSMEPIFCSQCAPSCSSNDSVQEWCSHLKELSQPYQLKFVRLAYVVPVYNKYARSLGSLRAPLRSVQRKSDAASSQLSSASRLTGGEQANERNCLSSSSSASASCTPSCSASSSPAQSQRSSPNQRASAATSAGEPIASESAANDNESDNQDGLELEDSKQAEADEEVAKQLALDIVHRTNKRHCKDEEEHQTNQVDDGFNKTPIGQLTYRLFAPCQLVKSSSCFSINPVNSSSPLARRGSVDLNGSGMSSENANPSTLLLGASPSLTSAASASHAHEAQQVITSFGAFFPALSHDIVLGAGSGGAHSDNFACSASSKHHHHQQQQQTESAHSRFTTNEFESVEAIRRRMEIYVTTNSMKVIAGETAIVNLSDALSCLSSAIEQTVVKAPFAQRNQTAWVSVYILYAAVEEPQLPGQLLAQQRMRELSLIDEEPSGTGPDAPAAAANGANGADNQAEFVFDDDFKTDTKQTSANNSPKVGQKQQQAPPEGAGIRIKQNPQDSSLTLYNSAYDRTVPLPTQPENYSDRFDPADLLANQADCLWLYDNHLMDAQQKRQKNAERAKGRSKRRKSKRKHGEESQCSIM